MTTKRRQIPTAPPARNIPVLLERCNPERIVNILAHKYQADLATFGIQASEDSIRDFVRALIRGEISLEVVEPAKDALTSQLSAEDTKAAKKLATALGSLVAIHDNDETQTLANTFALLLNRGILPLSTVINDPGKQQVAAAISQMRDIPTDRVIEVSILIEEHDSDLRALRLVDLYTPFAEQQALATPPTVDRGSFLVPAITIDLGTKRNRPQSTPPARTVVPKRNRGNNEGSGSPSHRQRKRHAAEDALQTAIDTLTGLAGKALRDVEIFCDEILHIPRVLPNLSTVQDFEGEAVHIQLPNMWLHASDLILGAPKLIVIEDDLSHTRAMSTSTYDEIAVLFCARTLDILMEAVLAKKLADVFQTAERNEHFFRGAKSITHILDALTALHKDMILGLRRPEGLQSYAATTTPGWAQLSTNPLIVSSTEGTTIPEDDIRLLSIGSHLPLEMTGALLAGNVQGEVWSVDLDDVADMKKILTLIDLPVEKVNYASMLRSAYGSQGPHVPVTDRSFLVGVRDETEFASIFQPLTSQYQYRPDRSTRAPIELALP